MPERRGLNRTTDMIVRAQLAAREEQNNPNSVTPKPDLFLGEDAPLPHALANCGSEGAARGVVLAMRERNQQKRNGTLKPDSNSQLNTNVNDNGWIMTLGLQGQDLGDPVDHALRRLKKTRSGRREGTVKGTNIFQSISSFFREDTTLSQALDLYGIYNTMGALLGVDDVRGHDVSTFANIPNIVTKSIKRTGISEKAQAYFETTALHMKRGAEDALDSLTSLYGSFLLRSYIDDIIEMKRQTSEVPQFDLQNAVKRVNAAYSSLLRMNDSNRDDSNFTSELEEIHTEIQSLDIELFCERIPVAARKKEEVLLGKWDPSLESYGKEYHSGRSLGKAGTLLEQKTKAYYKNVLGSYLNERYRLMNATEILKHEEGVDGIGISFIHKLDIARTRDGDHIVSFVGEPVSGKYAGDIVKYRQPLYVEYDGDTVLDFLPGNEEKNILELADSTLTPQGFSVSKPYFSNEHMVISEKAAGDTNLAELRREVACGQMTDQVFSEYLLSAINRMTEEAEDRLSMSLYKSLSQVHTEVEWDRSRRLVIFNDALTGQRTFYCLDLAYEPDRDTEHERYQGLTNWRVDMNKFQDSLRRIHAQFFVGQSSAEVIDLLVTSLKRSSTLFDPVRKQIGLGKGYRTKKLSTKPIRNESFPSHVARVFDGNIVHL